MSLTLSSLERVATGLWTVPAPLSLGPIHLNTRMTVVQLLDGGVVLISPIPLSQTLTAAIEAVGPVRAIVAPSLLHHLFVGEWMQAYPNAVSFGCEGLDRKRPELAYQHALGPVFDDLVGETLKRFPIAGMPKVNETLFFHPASHTLIATDFCFFMPEATGATWLYGKMMGFHTQPNCPPVFKWMIRN